jgi:phenylacetate-CoA ligase
VDGHAFAIRTVIGPLWAWWERSPYLRHVRFLKRTQFDAPERVRARQWNAVKAQVAHAYATVPYYRRRLDEAGIRPNDLQGFEDYRRLPILTKADIRANGTALRSSLYDPSRLIRCKTSGSTGVSLEVWLDEEASQWRRACTVRSDEWSGWRFGERVGAVWGNPDYLRHGWRGQLRNTLLERACYLDTLNMDESALERFAALVLRKQPPLLFGHAHSVYLFAQYVRAKGIKGIRPRGIITSAMALHTWERLVIEEVFGCKVTNRYGCEEVGLIACECEKHAGLHVNADNIYLEISRDGQSVPPGEPGSVLLTDLTNRAMPLLRYQIGDVAVAAEQSCPCGRGLPLLERVEGREADYVVTPSGRLISGISLTENFALEVPGLAQLQIVQEAVDRFRFRMVRGPEFGPASLERTRQLVEERFGSDVAYEIEYLDRIPPETSGKYRFCVSRVKNPFCSPLTPLTPNPSPPPAVLR